MCCLHTRDKEVRNKAVISFQEPEQPTVMSLASEGWDATTFYFTFVESYKGLEQCLCLIRVCRCHHLWDFKGLKKRKARSSRIKSPERASVEVLGPALAHLSHCGLCCVRLMRGFTSVCHLMSPSCYFLGVCYFCPELGFSSMISPLPTWDLPGVQRHQLSFLSL